MFSNQIIIIHSDLFNFFFHLQKLYLFMRYWNFLILQLNVHFQNLTTQIINSILTHRFGFDMKTKIKKEKKKEL